MVRTVFSISNGCGGFDRDGEIAAIFKFELAAWGRFESC